MALAGSPTDNPDQRISRGHLRLHLRQRLRARAYTAIRSRILSTLTSLVSFAIVLWSPVGQFHAARHQHRHAWLPVLGGAASMPALGTAVTHWIGRSLVRLYLRASSGSRRISVSVSHDCANTASRSRCCAARRPRSLGAMAKFANIYDNYMRIVHVRKTLTAFSPRPTIRRASTFPSSSARRSISLGKIQLGVLIQVARAFGSVNSSLTFFVSYYVGLADFKAVLDRLTSFDAAIDRRAGVESAKAAHRNRAARTSSDLRIEATRPRTAGRPRTGARRKPVASRRVSRHCWSVRPARASRPCFAPSPASGRSASAGSPSRKPA